jgi:hypothetical protein
VSFFVWGVPPPPFPSKELASLPRDEANISKPTEAAVANRYSSAYSACQTRAPLEASRSTFMSPPLESDSLVAVSRFEVNLLAAIIISLEAASKLIALEVILVLMANNLLDGKYLERTA